MIIKDYNLKDALLMKSNKIYDFMVWQPEKTYVVMGRGNKLEDSVFLENIEEDGVPLLRRQSGGQSVILNPDMLVISIVINSKKQYKSKKYFEVYNNFIISALKKIGIKDIEFKGFSDIAINDKKILGSSIYRNFKQVFYHAVLNICSNNDDLERYLKYPPNTPIYRKNRSHSEFVTSIKAEGYDFALNEIKKIIENEIKLKLSG